MAAKLQHYVNPKVPTEQYKVINIRTYNLLIASADMIMFPSRDKSTGREIILNLWEWVSCIDCKWNLLYCYKKTNDVKFIELSEFIEIDILTCNHVMRCQVLLPLQNLRDINCFSKNEISSYRSLLLLTLIIIIFVQCLIYNLTLVHWCWYILWISIKS